MANADAFETQLRVIAMSLAGDRTRAEDLLQDSLMRALIGKHSFELRTNLTSWMYRVMRNQLVTLHRKQHAPTISLDEPIAMAIGADGKQEHHMACRELVQELTLLPVGQQATILLVGAASYNYREAARAVGCTVGTVKSRISRARKALRARLLIDEPLSPRQARDQPRAATVAASDV